jgi:hypothetical protein
MTLILAVIAALEAGVIVWQIRRYREDRKRYVIQAAAWFNSAVAKDQRIKELRAEVNKTRRNTGKAEI